MDAFASSNLFEWIITILLATLFVVEFSLAMQERGLPGFMAIGFMACLSTFILIVFYFLLATDYAPLSDHVELRLAIFRPTFVAWLVFLIIKLTILSFVWRRRGTPTHL